MSSPVVLRLGRIAALTVLALFLATPLLVVAGVSLNASGLMIFPPDHLSLRWYVAFFADESWTSSLLVSLFIASAASLLATSIAFPIAYALWQWQSRLAALLGGLAALPFMLPAVVLAVVFMIFWSGLGRLGHAENVIATHGLVFVAMPLATLSLGFRAIDGAAVEAARTMGADDLAIRHTIVLPLVEPYLISGLMLVFIASLNEYLIAYMVAGFQVETLPVKVFNNLRMGFEPVMCVGAVLFMLIGVLCFGAIAIFGDLPRLLGGRTEN